MFYVTRGEDGAVQSVSKVAIDGSERMEDSHPEICAFFSLGSSAQPFDAADAEFVRVIEDLIDTLIMKNIIRHTDLPYPAQKKLLQRRGLRTQFNGGLDLFGLNENII
jgi:hypothetical protein